LEAFTGIMSAASRDKAVPVDLATPDGCRSLDPLAQLCRLNAGRRHDPA
jgi:hypothetical protein